MRCRACNANMSGVSQSYWREITLESGEKIRVMEDMCRDCRSKVFQYSLPEDFDLMDALGYDIDQEMF